MTASIFGVRSYTLSCNDIYQVFYFGYLKLALINLAYDPSRLESLHNLLDLE